MDKKVETSGKNKIYRSLGKSLADLGFERTKTSIFTRSREHVVDFIHLHKFTYCAGFRVHFGIRVLNDPFDAAALNGPASPDSMFKYGEPAASLTDCAEGIHQFCKTEGEDWFHEWSDLQRLMSSEESPLQQDERGALAKALAGQADQETVRTSKVILGIA